MQEERDYFASLNTFQPATVGDAFTQHRLSVFQYQSGTALFKLCTFLPRFQVDNHLLGALSESLAGNSTLQILNIARHSFSQLIQNKVQSHFL
jgi:hypothetical protein